MIVGLAAVVVVCCYLVFKCMTLSVKGLFDEKKKKKKLTTHTKHSIIIIYLFVVDSSRSASAFGALLNNMNYASLHIFFFSSSKLYSIIVRILMDEAITTRIYVLYYTHNLCCTYNALMLDCSYALCVTYYV